jgi:hypothetical protein
MPATTTSEVINTPAPEFAGYGGNILGGAARQLMTPYGMPKSYLQAGGPMMQPTQMGWQEAMGYNMGYGAAMSPNAFPGYAQQYAAGLYGPQSQMAERNYMDTMSGKYLSPESNPYLRASYDQAAKAMGDNFNTQVMPGLNTAFSQGGALGGSAHRAQAGRAASTLGGGLKDLATNMYGNAYQQERGLQAQFAGDVMGRAQQLAPQLGQLRNLSYQDSDAMRKLGADQRGYEDQRKQQIHANRMAAFQYEQGIYPQLANLYAAITKGTGMQSGTQTVPMLFDNPTAQAIGTVGAIAPIASAAIKNW